MGKIDDIISGVIQREGSAFTNDPKDSGGPTKYGITQAVLAKSRGRAVTAAEVAALTEAEARAIYRARYVEAPGYMPVLTLSQAVGEKLVDAGVNTGPARATTMLQRALNGLNRNGRDYADVAEDGECGAGTVAALSAFLRKRGREGETVLVRAINCQLGSFYLDLARGRPKDEEYVYGWLLQRVA